MQINSTFNSELGKEFYATLRKRNTEAEMEHIKSGKLSASKLGAPLLEQVLYVLGVPGKPIDDYALGLFRRGNDVEATAIDLLAPDETQVQVEYRNVIGIVDAIRNGMKYEVKSIKNSQVQYIDPNNTTRKRGTNGMTPNYQGVKYANALQAGLYGLADDDEYVTVLYIAADDLRPYAHVISVSSVKDEVNRIIDEFEAVMVSKTLPKWVEREPWQLKYPMYSMYPDFISLEPEQAMRKLELQYPNAYKKLTGGKN